MSVKQAKISPERTNLLSQPAVVTPDKENVKRLTKDIVKAAQTLTDDEARYLVDYFYITQEDRKRATNQTRALNEAEEPCLVVQWLAEQSTTLENQVKRALEAYTDAHPIGQWLKSVVGIGPVIAAGLLAHIDITRAPTVGHIWRFAGLDPTSIWDKGKKRPHNAALKTLCWKIGQSFMKFSNKDECVYGKLYRERKAFEQANSDAGKLAEQAKAKAEKVGKNTEAFKHYSQGKLSPGHIDARARRYAVKQFLSDLHAHWFEQHFGEKPPLPYPIAILGHAHLRK